MIHIEQQWAENLLTVEGEIVHEKAHNEGIIEKRGNIITMRGLRVHSVSLGVSGACDVVEFHADDKNGISLLKFDGAWRPYPVEYKRGKPKSVDADRLQLCCQAMCLEEMLACCIAKGAIFYNEPRRREEVEFSCELREKVRSMFLEMHEYQRRGYTPKVKTGAYCKSCSLNELCIPKLCKNVSAIAYINSELSPEEE